MGREEEVLNSNRPELVDLRECLESHQDHENLLYLTDRETILHCVRPSTNGQVEEQNSSLARSPDVDVLKSIMIKLQRRVKAGAATLLITVKDHSGDPLNEVTDIRDEMGRLKEDKEKTWTAQTS